MPSLKDKLEAQELAEKVVIQSKKIPKPEKERSEAKVKNIKK